MRSLRGTAPTPRGIATPYSYSTVPQRCPGMYQRITLDRDRPPWPKDRARHPAARCTDREAQRPDLMVLDVPMPSNAPVSPLTPFPPRQLGACPTLHHSTSALSRLYRRTLSHTIQIHSCPAVSGVLGQLLTLPLQPLHWRSRCHYCDYCDSALPSTTTKQTTSVEVRPYQE